MNTNAERILLVESDPDICDVIARQALQPLGYQVQVAGDANTAIQQAVQFTPDLVITNLNLPGLSGKDLLVALNSQGNSTPLIVLAEKGQENNVIQAFRLGASDYLLWPAREAEIISAVERVLKQVRERRAGQQLDRQLQETNQELQRRVRELTTIFAVGKAVISITDQRILFDKIVEGMVYVAEADFGWLLLRDERTKTFLLAAHRNLPEAWAKKTGQPLDDGISSLVALSGETLAINGDPLQRFKVAALGKSAVVVPVKIQQEVIGLLVVVRKTDQPFDRNMQALLEAVTDYASVSLVNSRLFRALQESADAAQAGEKHKLEQLQALRKEILGQLQPVTYPVDLALTGKMGALTDEQRQALQTVQSALQRVLEMVGVDRPPRSKVPPASG
ncbi:MAG: putative two-component sensor histidine kinase [Anaerolineaceae bacterium]|nr:MAG: putative two-component sensor histidine kinase [Anaerolineaceae bacterium]